MDAPRLRILCIDDHRDACELYKVCLERAGYEMRAAHTFGEGLRFIMNERFHLYLIDFRFPDGTGVELCKLIRALDRHTPIVLYSSDARESVRQQALEAGAQAFLVKPVGLDDLIETIARLTHR